MSVVEHVVVKGDTLWDITGRYLDDPYQWPRIWKYNNRKEVISITGQSIPNPDLIYPGQRIMIPRSPIEAKRSISQPKKPKPRPQGPSSVSLQEQLRHITDITAIAFDLGSIKLDAVPGPGFMAKISLKGSVTLKSRQGPSLIQFSQKPGVKTTQQIGAENAFIELMSSNKIGYDPKTGKVTLESMLVIKSKNSHAPSYAFGIAASSGAPIPRFKVEIGYTLLKGYIRNFGYVAQNVKFIIEIIPIPTPATPAPIGTLPEGVGATSGSSLAKTAAGVIVVGCVVLIVATIVEDFVTLGVGVADDPLSFGIAGGGMTLARGLWVGRVVLPRLSAPTVFRMSFALTPLGMAHAAGASAADTVNTKIDGKSRK